MKINMRNDSCLSYRLHAKVLARMEICMKRTYFLSIFCVLHALFGGRSVHRYCVSAMPRINVWSSEDATEYVLIDHNLRPVPLMHAFDETHFIQHLWPSGTILFRSTHGAVSSATIDQLIHELIDEITRKEKKYRNFRILKASNFIRHKRSGLLILKFKDYPFILKLFIDLPSEFINPYAKGFEATNFFIAGGAMRHTLGFTRIKTLEYVQNAIENNDHWRDRFSMPRKWFWLPKKPIWLYVRLFNLGDHERVVRMPAVYGVIADELFRDPHKTPDYYELMAFSKFVEHRIDPHTKNFFIERNTGKIALVDTELFPMILGFTECISGRDSHLKWYLYLAGKYLREKMGATRSARLLRCRQVTSYYF